MNTQQLRSILEKIPDDMEVILQKDGEGNGYSPLAGAESNVLYIADSSWDGDCIHPDDEAKYVDDPDTSRVVVLWPVN